MTTLRKAMPLLLFCAALLVTCLPLAAQNNPDCSFTHQFTGNDSTWAGVSNLSNNTPCVNWRVTFSATGTLTTQVTIQTSPDGSTWTSVPNTICSATVQPPCLFQGSNPTASGAQGMIYASIYGNYVRVITSGSAGTGTDKATVRGYGAKGATASTLPQGSGGGGGSGTVTQVNTTGPITGGPITGSGTIALDTTKVAQKFFGTAAPGSVAANLPGDLFTDTTAHNEYVCNAPAGTAAPACTSVTAAGWLLVNGGGGGSGTVTNTGTLTSNAVILGNGGVDVKPGAVLPADATKFYNGAGAFTAPPAASAVPAASNLTPVTVSANTTGDQTLQEVALTAGALNTVLAANLIHGSGRFTIAALQTPTLTFKAKLCTVSGCGSGTVVTLATITSGATLASTSDQGWNLQLMAGTSASGATGNLWVHGAPGLTVDIGALPGSAATPYTDTNTAVSSNIDLTGVLYVDFIVATSSGNAGNSITQDIAEVLPQGAGGGGGGGGSSITQGTFAALPATCAAGDLYFITDSAYTARCSATNTFSFFLGQFGLVTPPPASGTWSSDNIGSGTFDTTNGYGYASLPTAGGSDQLRLLYRAAPSTPYAISIGMRHDLSGTPPGSTQSATNTNAGYGVGFRDGTGKIVFWMIFFVGSNGGTNATISEIDRWTNSTTISTNYAANLWNSSQIAALDFSSVQPKWMCLSDDGSANITFYWSVDRQHWKQYFQVSRTDFFGSGPTQVTWGSENKNETSELQLLDWTVNTSATCK